MVGKEKNKGIQYDAQSVGRRKSSIARVYVKEGSGKILINKRDRNLLKITSNFWKQFLLNQQHVDCNPTHCHTKQVL